ncbi:hypothetical protein JR316_0003562 [Psilocybe cubensis]|uniref:Uncharacterized protein n=2 Tax=Psilocybe cubensis TaxID=181762 RepID=A0A8H7Y5F0_PSICU|nr:hypothetical protein JR316_0003562 [Psilocybe cubensis]KAH9484082.1 hypothetical protein JR316_0003562 [Psilocybe cubensis]
MKLCVVLSFIVAVGITGVTAHVADDTDDTELFARTWGTGKWTMDDDLYHRTVKPHFLSVFKGMPSFTGLCGSNPDFFIEKDGTVYPSAVESKAKKLGKCTKSKYNADMSEYLTELLQHNE